MTTTTKERPILFSGPMVRAILDGRKGQTRRVLKPQPEWERGAWSVPGFFSNTEVGFAEGILRSSFRSPYGQPGDRLWVREKWRPSQTGEGSIAPAWYAADGDDSEHHRWKPSIHMPRWASRLSLEVTGVRVERVQDINLGGIAAEGWPGAPKKQTPAWLVSQLGFIEAGFEWFEGLWDAINGKRGFGWDVNPWVWVVEFERVTA